VSSQSLGSVENELSRWVPERSFRPIPDLPASEQIVFPTSLQLSEDELES